MVYRHAARVAGLVMFVGVGFLAVAFGLPSGPSGLLSVLVLVVLGALFAIGGLFDPVSVGPVSLRWYYLVGAGFVVISAYFAAALLVAVGDGRWTNALVTVPVVLCNVWLGVFYARNPEGGTDADPETA